MTDNVIEGLQQLIKTWIKNKNEAKVLLQLVNLTIKPIYESRRGRPWWYVFISLVRGTAECSERVFFLTLTGCPESIQVHSHDWFFLPTGELLFSPYLPLTHNSQNFLQESNNQNPQTPTNINNKTHQAHHGRPKRTTTRSSLPSTTLLLPTLHSTKPGPPRKGEVRSNQSRPHDCTRCLAIPHPRSGTTTTHQARHLLDVWQTLAGMFL